MLMIEQGDDSWLGIKRDEILKIFEKERCDERARVETEFLIEANKLKDEKNVPREIQRPQQVVALTTNVAPPLQNNVGAGTGNQSNSRTYKLVSFLLAVTAFFGIIWISCNRHDDSNKNTDTNTSPTATMEAATTTHADIKTGVVPSVEDCEFELSLGSNVGELIKNCGYKNVDLDIIAMWPKMKFPEYSEKIVKAKIFSFKAEVSAEISLTEILSIIKAHGLRPANLFELLSFTNYCQNEIRANRVYNMYNIQSNAFAAIDEIGKECYYSFINTDLNNCLWRWDLSESNFVKKIIGAKNVKFLAVNISDDRVFKTSVAYNKTLAEVIVQSGIKSVDANVFPHINDFNLGKQTSAQDVDLILMSEEIKQTKWPLLLNQLLEEKGLRLSTPEELLSFWEQYKEIFSNSAIGIFAYKKEGEKWEWRDNNWYYIYQGTLHKYSEVNEYQNTNCLILVAKDKK